MIIPQKDKANCYLDFSTILNNNGSTIGIGLFAKQKITHTEGKKKIKGTYICSYFGDQLHPDIAMSNDYNSLYVMIWNNDIAIDAKNTHCYGKYANDPIILDKYNAIVENAGTKNNPKFHLMTTKTIEKDSEIFIRYSDVSYWKDSTHFEALNAELQKVLYDRNKTIKKWVDENYWPPESI